MVQRAAAGRVVSGSTWCSQALVSPILKSNSHDLVLVISFYSLMATNVILKGNQVTRYLLNFAPSSLAFSCRHI